MGKVKRLRFFIAASDKSLAGLQTFDLPLSRGMPYPLGLEDGRYLHSRAHSILL